MNLIKKICFNIRLSQVVCYMLQDTLLKETYFQVATSMLKRTNGQNKVEMSEICSWNEFENFCENLDKSEA